MSTNKHLLLSVPEQWSNDQKGDFYEGFVKEILKPMRFQVVQRIHFTGMEIDLLAKGQDQPQTVLVECKAQRDPIAAEVISKLFGNVGIRKADSGWLFSTSDLTKDAKGQWDDIQNDPALAKKFIWFSPSRTIEVLISQESVVDPLALSNNLEDRTVGDWTLCITPSKRAWLAQIIEDGLPRKFCVFDAKTGKPLRENDSKEIADLSARFSSLEWMDSSEAESRPSKLPRNPVAMVISGDAWDDPRPARPSDFVGRDQVLEEMVNFLEDVRLAKTSTRTFSIQGPSGWGKSSIILKVAELANSGEIAGCSLTAIDTRSATNSSFVSEALRLAFVDAAKRGFIPTENKLRVDSVRDPLDSPDLLDAFKSVQKKKTCIVLIFDQFEELFSKEKLFETFNAVKDLSLDIDARRVPMVLGFAWKTDVSLPQQHPAYHLWHELSSRRRAFKIAEFGDKDIRKIISSSERASGQKLSSAIRSRFIEQCQGLPWLLKKLLVHVLKRVSTVESQYLLLERELDVELLFKEDLSVLGEEQIKCLKFVALRAPVAVAEVEENYSRDTTNLLINSHLLVRSGMNYVVYWDIFRDYLIDGRVPSIPWARTFQRDPSTAVRALQKIDELGSASSATLAPAIGLQERPCVNLMVDLIPLQLLDPVGVGLYKTAGHLKDLTPKTIAECAQGQLRRHIVVKELTARWSKDTKMTSADWFSLFSKAHPRFVKFSRKTINQYANTFRRWLVFAGLLEQKGKSLLRPSGRGGQMGVLTPVRGTTATFLGTAAPKALIRLINLLVKKESIHRSKLVSRGLRNAIADASALGVCTTNGHGSITLTQPGQSVKDAIASAKTTVLNQPSVKNIAEAIRHGQTDINKIGKHLATSLGANWKATSARRYANGIRRYYTWARG
jgi:hypothetical protein